ncbi:hypothetical protein WA026_021781 [Henosepilachna vigintioctopunctata]|uniref:Uncharacterized protein n=1 Tax=Henosepilachna vigintioctopunctata TaxID=420089 RepID=A0AAW1TY53_9CUCU
MDHERNKNLQVKGKELYWRNYERFALLLGKKRTLSESSCGSSSSNDLDNEANLKDISFVLFLYTNKNMIFLLAGEKAKSTPASHSIAAFEERSMKSEQNKERRFKDFLAFKAQKAEGLISTKNEL